MKIFWISLLVACNLSASAGAVVAVQWEWERIWSFQYWEPWAVMFLYIILPAINLIAIVYLTLRLERR
jgi:hypothetical protein